MPSAVIIWLIPGNFKIEKAGFVRWSLNFSEQKFVYHELAKSFDLYDKVHKPGF